jgi:Novel STAND NTPase 1
VGAAVLTWTASAESPYVGPRPFSSEDRDVFFGREAEIAELLSAVIAHRAVLVYSVSGAGKSSLLSAGLVPALQAQGMEVLPTLRLQAPAALPDAMGNAFTSAALWGLSRLEGEPEQDVATLADALASIPRGTDPYGFPRPRVLVFDQFEELFTLHQNRWPDRDGFLRDIGASLERDPELRVVFAIREEYVAQLERYERALPDGLRARFHVERLRRQSAIAAVTGPLGRAGIEFGSGVAEALVTDLLAARVDLGDGRTLTVEGEFVEPVQLQVVCRTLWSELGPDVRRIDRVHLAALGSVDESLMRYYDQAIAASVARSDVAEHRLRDQLESTLITPAGTRATMFAGTNAPSAVPDSALQELRERHLVRGEWRAGGQWIELAHDRLIEPIRASNSRVRSRRVRSQRRRGAVLAAVALLIVGAAVGLLLARREPTPPRGPSLTSLIAAYPGDQASRVELARWMGRAAKAARVPPELPVMTALVESGMKNLQYGDADTRGFFQMQKSVWNRGPYRQFWRKPTVQLRWFINQAISVRSAWVTAGDRNFGSDPRKYGVWAADIGRPNPVYRGRFQLRLDEARSLLQEARVETTAKTNP